MPEPDSKQNLADEQRDCMIITIASSDLTKEVK